MGELEAAGDHGGLVEVVGRLVGMMEAVLVLREGQTQAQVVGVLGDVTCLGQGGVQVTIAPGQQ